jgi:hypothetical protein
MSEWEGTLEQRNERALKAWQCRRSIPRLHIPDAQSPRERQYLDYCYSRKLESARSFLDRLRYTHCWAGNRAIAALIPRPF